jgi:O-methyltransferase involved in polyketide biosynthesis
MTDDQLDGSHLTDVSETGLMTLWQRAREAARPDGIISDPKAIELMEKIDYDYSRFSRPSQVFAVRAKVFDSVIRNYLESYPDGTVVALAEGLQTTFWRIESPAVRWASLDLPAVVDIRRKLLPVSSQIRYVSGSAFDPSWISEVDGSAPVLICIEGLLQYFRPEQSLGLLEQLAGTFRRSRIVFDSIPGWVARRSEKGQWPGNATRAGGGGFSNPGLPFSVSASEAIRLLERLDGIASARTAPMVGGRGIFGFGLSTMTRLPGLRNIAPAVIVADTR